MTVAKTNERDETLTTISAKVPRWVEDVFITVARDADIDESKAYRIALGSIASFLAAHWQRGPALSSFLEHLRFDVEQYNIFFQRSQGK